MGEHRDTGEGGFSGVERPRRSSIAPDSRLAKGLAVIAGLGALGLAAVLYVLALMPVPEDPTVVVAALQPALMSKASAAKAPVVVSDAGADATEVVDLPKPAEPPARAVDLSIVVRPKGARLFINGREYANPMRSRWPRGTDPLQIKMEYEGYQSLQRFVLLDGSKRLEFELRKKATAKAPPNDAGAEPEES